MGVAEAAIAARKHDPLTEFGEVGDQRFVVLFEAPACRPALSG
jgi:hypothetical protein